MEDLLTIRKSVKLLTKMVAYGAMILWVVLLSLILSTPAHAQSANQKKPVINLSWEEPIQRVENTQYELIDIDEWGTITIKVTKYNEDGTLMQDGYYLGDKRHGLWTLYNENQPVSQLEYNRNNRVWTKIYKENGFDMVFYRDNRPIVIKSEQYLASN
jgi:hypothetical protein